MNPPSHTVLSLQSKRTRIVIDSGASTSGTGQREILKDIRPATCHVTAAFGEVAKPTEMGLLPPFMLSTIVISEMKDTTLLSVSQLCAEGMVGIFTRQDCRFYKAEDVIPHLQSICKSSQPVLSGNVEEGLYLLGSN